MILFKLIYLLSMSAASAAPIALDTREMATTEKSTLKPMYSTKSITVIRSSTPISTTRITEISTILPKPSLPALLMCDAFLGEYSLLGAVSAYFKDIIIAS